MGLVHQFTDNQTGSVIKITRADTGTKDCLLRVYDNKGMLRGERRTYVTWEPIFGPDVADVHMWEQLATEIIDAPVRNNDTEDR
jgi:hypothetical protein